MSLNDVVPFFTIPGSIVAFITGGFLIWEKVVRYRPAIFLVSKAPSGFGTEREVFLRVINRSERPIIFSWDKGLSANAMRLSLSNDTYSIVSAHFKGRQTVVLDGNEDRLFPAFPPSNWDAIGSDGTMEVVVTWRFVQPITWQRERRQVVKVDKSAYEQLVNHATATHYTDP
ncbi:hypothetical protein MRS76_11310 [Rhizobiaceae bacterium n13]|uniref:hypothetical protein n=1 Tax=Ferirhizobium litorale TaxID=2927786 RepID=UPI0024B29C79|nr:hypothetical protein [Fererhizobium litorale]MDI7862549.1 hypothetical protein [Fererhizobium litorale]